MRWGNSSAAKHLHDVNEELRALGLERHAGELERFGFTVVEPERVAPPEFVEQLRNAVLGAARRRGAVRNTGGSAGESDTARDDRPIGELLYHVLFEDRIFEHAIVNRAALALISYLLGESCVLSSLSAGIKSHTDAPLVLHCDNGMVPAPFPPYAQVANATWVLSDYTKEDGCLCVVPGSHRFCRHPTPSEVADLGAVVPVEVPAGSLIVWGGNLWHGAFPKRTPGLRLNLIMLYCRLYMLPQEPLRYEVTQEILERNPLRFAKLMGEHIVYGWKDGGPQWTEKGPRWTRDRVKYLDFERDPDARLFD